MYVSTHRMIIITHDYENYLLIFVLQYAAIFIQYIIISCKFNKIYLKMNTWNRASTQNILFSNKKVNFSKKIVKQSEYSKQKCSKKLIMSNK